jgi:hypothetical protein
MCPTIRSFWVVDCLDGIRAHTFWLFPFGIIKRRKLGWKFNSRSTDAVVVSIKAPDMTAAFLPPKRTRIIVTIPIIDAIENGRHPVVGEVKSSQCESHPMVSNRFFTYSAAFNSPGVVEPLGPMLTANC